MYLASKLSILFAIKQDSKDFSNSRFYVKVDTSAVSQHLAVAKTFECNANNCRSWEFSSASAAFVCTQ